MRSLSKQRKAMACGARALAIGVLSSFMISSNAAPAEVGAKPAPVPSLMLPYGSGWSGGIGRRNGLDVPAADFLPEDYRTGQKYREAALARGVPADKVDAYLRLRLFGHHIPSAEGIGPVMDDPARPYFNNAVARELGLPSTVRVPDVNGEGAKNLKPWAYEALKRQAELARAGKNVQTRQARCWELGVPNLNEVPQPLYFIQTPDEVVMYLGHRVRHVYMDAPHTTELKPSWYGESVGRFEGDTLVVDTIGLNDKTFVDGYRTPHTDQMRVIERYRVINGGKGLETSYTVEDPATFHQPWSARRPRYLLTDNPLTDKDRICAAGSEDLLNEDLEQLQKAVTPDF